jgi:hypothetical protein
VKVAGEGGRVDAYATPAGHVVLTILDADDAPQFTVLLAPESAANVADNLKRAADDARSLIASN